MRGKGKKSEECPKKNKLSRKIKSRGSSALGACEQTTGDGGKVFGEREAWGSPRGKAHRPTQKVEKMTWGPGRNE